MSSTHSNPYIGHPSQLLRINDYVSVDGLARGMHATDIHNGRLSLTVCADKGMDFPYLSYKGTNIGYVTPCGLVGSSYFDDRDNGFLRGFFAGFLTTCGLDHMGAACDMEGRHYGLHGRINNLPAEEYAARLAEDTCGCRCVVDGRMRQAVLFGENLTLHREVIIGCEENGFSFTDTVTNRGFQPQQHMILYHFNIGYPLLDESAEVIIPHSKVEARDEYAKASISKRLQITKPIPGQQEMCYFYKLLQNESGQSLAGIYNHRLRLGVVIRFDTALLDHFTQWKMMGAGEYALGLEPGNATPLGIREEKALGHVKTLKPWETRTYRFTIQVMEGEDDLAGLKAEIEKLRPPK